MVGSGVAAAIMTGATILESSKADSERALWLSRALSITSSAAWRSLRGAHQIQLGSWKSLTTNRPDPPTGPGPPTGDDASASLGLQIITKDNHDYTHGAVII